MADLIGQRIGQYEILSELGEGGMARVYRARQASVARDVAIKIIRSDLLKSEEFTARFAREAQTIASMSHTNIVKVFDYGQHDTMVYLVMELLMGGSLAELIHGKRFSLAQTSRLLDQVAAGLDYAHRRGIIHRDLKPPNILLDEDHNAILTDFGIAKLLSETTKMTQTGMVIGTPAYMSPEQWSADAIDSRTDIYSLGVMVYEMLTGSTPFRSDTPARMMYKHLNDAPPPITNLRADVPPSLDAVIQKAMAKDRAYRYQSAGEFATAFRTAVAALPNADMVPAGSAAGVPTVSTRRTPLVIVLGIVVVLLVLIIGGIALSSSRSAAASTSTLAVAAVSTSPGSASAARITTITVVAAVAAPPTSTIPTLTNTPLSYSVTIPTTVSPMPGPSVTSSATTIPATATLFPTKTAPPTAIPASATPIQTPRPTVTLTASDTPISDDDLASTLGAQYAQTAAAQQTATATAWTHTPTTTPPSTVDRFGTANVRLTERVIGTRAAQQTLTATRWTQTPTATYTVTDDIPASVATLDAQRVSATAQQTQMNQTVTAIRWTKTPTSTRTPSATYTPITVVHTQPAATQNAEFQANQTAFSTTQTRIPTMTDFPAPSPTEQTKESSLPSPTELSNTTPSVSASPLSRTLVPTFQLSLEPVMNF